MEEHYASWLVEIDISRTGFETAQKLSALLAQRLPLGPCLIVCSQPRNFLPPLRKRWLHVLRLLEKEMAGSLGNTRRELKAYLQHLEGVQFLISQPEETAVERVFLLRPEDVREIPASIATIFVLSPITLPELQFWGRKLRDDCKLVLFRRGTFPPAAERVV